MLVDCRTHYDALIDENNDSARDPKPLRDYMDKWDGERFISSLNLNGDESVLEIGVGTGRLAVRVAPRCRQFTGIDLSPKSIERGRENLSNFGNATLLLADFLGYPFTDTYDVIYSSLTFMHIKEKQDTVNKSASLLNPGGRFVLSVTKSQDTLLDIGTRQLSIFPTNPDAILQWAEEAGLQMAERYERDHAHVFVFVRT